MWCFDLNMIYGVFPFSVELLVHVIFTGKLFDLWSLTSFIELYFNHAGYIVSLCLQFFVQ